MHDAKFSEAVVPQPCVILRTLLRPYSIGHEILLTRHGNPLVALTGVEFSALPTAQQIESIRMAVLICRDSWLENQVAQNPREFVRWMRRHRNDDFALAIADFRNYRYHGSLFPPTPSDEDSLIAEGKTKPDEPGRDIGSPFAARLYTFIAHLPEREILLHGKTAFDFPFGFACFLYFAELESKGQLKIENAKEAQVREEMRAHQEAILREHEAAKKGGE